MDSTKLNILGTEYTIYLRSIKEDVKLDRCDGYCDFTTKTIVICEHDVDSVMDIGDKYNRYCRILRHEIIHAFLYESGLDTESDFASDEVCVDFFAIQLLKIYEAFNNAKDIFRKESDINE